MSSRTARVACILAALAAASCSRKSPAETERLAILRFENLSPGAAPDWMGRAFAEVITAELSGASLTLDGLITRSALGAEHQVQ